MGYLYICTYFWVLFNALLDSRNGIFIYKLIHCVDRYASIHTCIHLFYVLVIQLFVYWLCYVLQLTIFSYLSVPSTLQGWYRTTVRGCYNVVFYNLIMYTMTKLEHRVKFLQKTPHMLTLMGELWGANCDCFLGNWPCYNGTVLYWRDGYYISTNIFMIIIGFSQYYQLVSNSHLGPLLPTWIN